MISTKQRLELEEKIGEWIEENCEEIDFWWPENSASKFANSIISQIEFAEESCKIQEDQ